MTTTDTEALQLVYRGLDRCDLCGGGLAPVEQLAGGLPRLSLAGSAAETTHVHRYETRQPVAVEERTLCSQ